MYPKPTRLRDNQATRKARERDGACLYGLWHKDGCEGGLEGHHIITRGAGGADDIRQIVTVCHKHHEKAQRYEIPADELRRLMTVYHGYRYDQNGVPED